MKAARNRQLHWLIAIRTVAITSMVLPYALAGPALDPGAPKPRLFLYYLLGFTYILNVVYLGLLRLSRGRLERQAVLQLFGDLTIITGLVYYFGGPSSSFSLLYLVVISVGATLLSRRLDLVLANVGWLCYAALILGLQAGWIPPNGDPMERFLAYNLIVHFLGFNAVALLVSYVTRDVRNIEVALEEREADLAQLESFHRDVTNSLSSGLVTTDQQGTVITINPAGRKILGVPGRDAVGRPVYEVGICSRDEWQQVAKTTNVLGLQREESIHRDGDHSIFIGYSVTPLQGGAGRQAGYIVIFQDVTRWRELEQELRMKDRMAAIGELSAGIAHEIRNPLAAISGSVQMLSSATSQTGSSRKLLEIITDESRRLDRTIEGFLQYARPREKSVADFDIAELLRANAQLLRNSAEVTDLHRIEVDLEPPHALIVADKDQVSQIFWNLARNALSAMPDGGRLLIRGKLSESAYQMSFSDQGQGMSEEERRSMFQPFKSAFDGGTGLGMAIVYRLVQEHAGRLSVESEPDHGTTIAVVLPVGTELLERGLL